MSKIAELLKIKEKRIALCKKSIFLFGLFYFTHYFTHKSAFFHRQMAKEAQFEGHNLVAWIMFRESAKTVWARIKILHALCYDYKKNIIWVSAVNDLLSKPNVRAIANELQANKKLIRDFGELYYDAKRDKKEKSRPKQISAFKTTLGGMVRALSTRASARGLIEDEFRPDLIIFDDIENDEIKKSIVKTKTTQSFIDEVIAGRAVDCDILFLGNFITKFGVIAQLVKRIKKEPRAILHWRNIIENGKITWDSRIVMTDKEADELNSKIKNPKKHFKSVEAMKRELGSSRFAQEMMNIPMSSEDQIVKEEWYENGKGFYETWRLKKDFAGWVFDNGDKKYRLETVTAVDPASSTKESADNRAICTIGKCKIDGDWYYFVLACKAGRWGIAEFARILRQERDKWNPSAIVVESVGVQDVFRSLFQRYQISTSAIRPDGDKVRRMNANVAEMEFGFVLFPSDDSCLDLLNELFNFTGEDGRPDDQVDGFNYSMKKLKGGGDEGIESSNDENSIVGNVIDKEF